MAGPCAGLNHPNPTLQQSSTTMIRSLPILLMCLLFLGGCARPVADQSPADSTPVELIVAAPVARTVDVVERQFGLELPDPYRWMEGVDNDEFKQWLRDQGRYARQELDALPTHGQWRERLAEASRGQRAHSRHQRVAGRVFFIRREGASTGVLMMAEHDGSERMLLDPATLEGSGRASIVDFRPSPDGRKVAVGIDRDGSEISHTQVLDVATATLGPNRFGPGLGQVEWLPDSDGFLYYQFADGEDRVEHDPYQNLRLRLHRLDADTGKQDPIVLAAGRNPALPMQSHEFPGVLLTAASNWLVAGTRTTSPHFRACVAPDTAPLSDRTPWRCLIDYDDGVTDFVVRADTMYLVSNRDHPNGRVLALDVSDPEASVDGSRELLPEADDAVVSRIIAGRDALYVKRMRNGIDTVMRLPLDGSPATELALPLMGTIRSFSAEAGHDGFFYSLEGWTAPTTVYSFHPATGVSTDLRLGSSSSIDTTDITSLQIEATSADGTRVPVSIIHRRDLALDGSAIAYVEGYGGYGYSLQPFFDPIALQWVKQGHVAAVAHVRGGGEKGEAWRLGGHGANKHKGVEDLLAGVDALVDRGYTGRDRVGISGRSAGGLLIGGALARAPQQFSAAFIGVGWLNPVRLLEGPGGASHIQEAADPRTAEGLHVLAAMDPYQTLRANADYPPVLLTVGMNDPRVPGWEAGKFAARLQALSERPVWLGVLGDTGHFAASLDARGEDFADLFAFFETMLGRR